MEELPEEGKKITKKNKTDDTLVEEFILENCLSVASSPLPAALHVKVFDQQLVFEATGMRSGKKIVFDKTTNELQVAWPQRSPLDGTIRDDPDPLTIPLANIQKLILGRDDPGGNPLLQDFAIRIQENEEINELMAGDSRLLRIVRLISDFIKVEFRDETQLDPTEYGYEVPITEELPEASKIMKQEDEDLTSFFWVDKGDLIKYWGYFAVFTLFYAIIFLQFFAGNSFMSVFGIFLWILIFRMVLSLPKTFYSKIILAPTYIGLKRASTIEELEAIPQIPFSHIESVRLTMVTNTKPGLEVVTNRAVHWIGYDISPHELGYLYSSIRTIMNIKKASSQS